MNFDVSWSLIPFRRTHPRNFPSKAIFIHFLAALLVCAVFRREKIVTKRYFYEPLNSSAAVRCGLKALNLKPTIKERKHRISWRKNTLLMDFEFMKSEALFANGHKIAVCNRPHEFKNHWKSKYFCIAAKRREKKKRWKASE